VPPAWKAQVDALIGRAAKPVMVLRPLVERTEWRGCAARNPDPVAYAALYNSIRDRFFVVSLADLVPGVEHMVTNLPADICLHKGELDIEAIAGLMARADLTFCSPGFAVPLSQAVGTPVIAVFGGFECSRSFSGGHRFAPTLGIDPINPCQCWSHTHNCDKRIDLPAAHIDIEEFIADNVAERAEVFAGRAPDRLGRFAEAVHE
jgi:ADP-heptose:LPS heptosyltransferase